MKDKWLQTETFPKSILVSLIYTLLLIIVGLILLVVNTSYIYGVLVGSGILYTSYILIWLIWYKIPKIKLKMVKATAWLAPIIRIAIFLTTFLLIVFLVNEGTGLDIFINPINTIMMLVTYTFTIFSYGTVIVIDSILEKKNKEIKKEEVE